MDLEGRDESRPYKVAPRSQAGAGYSGEPRFRELWGLHNTGQSVLGSVGVRDVDTNAPEAAAVTLGDPDLVVAVIDDGVDFSHLDLAGREWVNAGEAGTDASGGDRAANRADDDGNGYVDDVYGWDFCSNDNTVHDPLEGDAHGTHVAGTLAASLNGEGIVGMAPNVRVMALKFLGPTCGYDSQAIRALEYARTMGIRLSNNSWSGGGYSRSLKEAIEASGMLFVAAAGNGGDDGIGDDLDREPVYPAAYDSPNILSTGAITNRGELATFSNRGARSVDILAPGEAILSSLPAVPARSGLVLASPGAGRAVVSGFGVEEIFAPEGRAAFVSAALEALGRSPEPVLLVDDALSYFAAADATPALRAATKTATGAEPRILATGNGRGPSLQQLTGKAVVWSTGKAYFSLDADGKVLSTLTPGDRSVLTQFLNAGGKLILTGMDALLDIERTAFVTRTLGDQVYRDA